MSHCAVQKRNVCALRKKWDAARTGVSCRPGCPIGAHSPHRKKQEAQSAEPAQRRHQRREPRAHRPESCICSKAELDSLSQVRLWLTPALNLGASAKFSGSTLLTRCFQPACLRPASKLASSWLTRCFQLASSLLPACFQLAYSLAYNLLTFLLRACYL